MNAGNQSKYFPMVEKGHEIGNHSKTHSDLTNSNNLKGEITDYKYDLEQRSKAEVVAFATPYCYYNDAVEAEIAKAEAIGGELEAKLVTASESGDGNAITSIAKDMDENKKLTEELYAAWEKASAELEAAKDKYKLD